MNEDIDTSVDPRARKLVLECIGRIRGRFLYSEEEAIDTIKAVLAQPLTPKHHGGYKASADLPQRKPWKPGDPKPKRMESA